jgi:hypothetical protein
MRTLLGIAIAAAGLTLLAAAPANAGPIPVSPKPAVTDTTAGVQQVHWRHRGWGHHRYYRSYGYYPRYRSYGYYGGGFPGFGIYIGPRHRWGHHRW